MDPNSNTPRRQTVEDEYREEEVMEYGGRDGSHGTTRQGAPGTMWAR